MRDCDICGGRGSVRLAVMPRVADVRPRDTSVAVDMDAAVRTYPCPECSETLKPENLGVIQTISSFGMEAKDPGIREHVEKNAAHKMVDQLRRAGYIRFQWDTPDKTEMTVSVRATLGVVSPKQVATFEERVNARQRDVAALVADRAAQYINVWGYYFNATSIRKADAVRFVAEALKTVIEEQSSPAPPVRAARQAPR